MTTHAPFVPSDMAGENAEAIVFTQDHGFGDSQEFAMALTLEHEAQHGYVAAGDSVIRKRRG